MCDKLNEEELSCASLVFDTEELSKKCVPTQTQIRQQLGSKLSDVFFEFLGSEARAYLGLEPPLEGPDTTWVSPGARIQNKVALTPVPEPKVVHLKSLTHGSILEVGQKYVEKLENKHRMAMEAALKAQAEELEEECKRKMADSGDVTAGEGASSCKKIVATLMEHFDTCFNELVKTTQLRMRKECQIRVEEERAEVAALMFAQMKDQLERQDQELCCEFHDILFTELNLLASRYIKQINKEREVAVELMRETVRNYEKMLQDIRTEMEINSLVDVCQAITSERVACNERIREIKNESKKDDCRDIIDGLEKENCVLQKMATERLKRLMQWRKKVRALLEEFQKFINFALKTVPGQAEYLLDMEKLLLKKYPEDSFLLPEDYLCFKNCMEGKLSFTELDQPPKEEVCEEPKIETPGESAPSDEINIYCQSINYKEEKGEEEAGLTFNYDTFKTMLVNKFASDVVKSKAKKGGKKGAVCLWKKKSKPVSLDKDSEMYQILTLAGENEKEHLAPASCFLRKRLDTVIKVCGDDPEFAKIILGCPDK